MDKHIDDLIKNIYSEISSISYLSHRCSDPSLKALLDETLSMYECHNATLKNKLHDLGIATSKNSGIFGRIGETAFEMKTLFTQSSDELKSQARNIIESNIDTYKNFVSSNSISNNEINLLIKGMIEDNEYILQKYS